MIPTPGHVGIDLSASAISVASKQQNERSTFLAADCENYSPEGRFDVIVFNEVLCCLRDPLQTVERYVRYLNSGGLVLVSLCSAARGSATIQWRLQQAYATVDEVQLTPQWQESHLGVHGVAHAGRVTRGLPRTGRVPALPA